MHCLSSLAVGLKCFVGTLSIELNGEEQESKKNKRICSVQGSNL
jgi:hypothetical protein